MQPPQAALPTLSSGFRSTEQPAKWYLEAPDYFYAAICILGQAWRAAAAQGIPRQVVTAGQLGLGPARDCPEDAANVSRGPLRATWCPAPSTSAALRPVWALGWGGLRGEHAPTPPPTLLHLS